MNFFERAGLSFLHRFDPETAHGLSLQALRLGAAKLPVKTKIIKRIEGI